MRLPIPYRPEADIVAAPPRRPGRARSTGPPPPQPPRPGCRRCATTRRRSGPWKACCKEYPISSAEGLALMRLAEALLRVPDAETAIALTADQLGRADFDGAADGALARLSRAAIAMSKKFLPRGDHARRACSASWARAPWWPPRCARCSCWAASSCWARPSARRWARRDGAQQDSANLRFSYDMLGEGARTDADALRYLAQLPRRHRRHRGTRRPARRCEHNDGISIKLSALHPRYEDAQRERVMAELVPRVWALCEQAAARQHQPHHRRRGGRPARAVARRVRGAGRAGGRASIRSGRASAWRCRPTRRARWN